jgi:hypothetical protein
MRLVCQYRRTYTAVDEGVGYSKSFEAMTCPKHLDVGIGAQVMLLRHLHSELTYGTLGIVTGFSNRWSGRLGGSVKVSDSNSWPLVRFLDSADISRMILVEPFRFTVRLGNGHEISRTQVGPLNIVEVPQAGMKPSQVPLVLGWAATLEATQGMAFHSVYVDLGKHPMRTCGVSSKSTKR